MKISELVNWKKEIEKLKEISFEETNDLVFNFYRDALKDITELAQGYIDKYDSLTFSKKIEFQSLLRSGNEIQNILIGANKGVSESTRKHIEKMSELGYFGTFYHIDGMTDLGLSLGSLDTKLIRAVLERNIDSSLFSNRLHSNTIELAERVREELLKSLYTGDSYAEVAKRLQKEVQSVYNRSIRIVRTEGSKYNAEATQKAYEDAEALGLDLMKEWVSSGDNRVRRSHDFLSGQQVPIDKPFTNKDGREAMYPGGFGIASEDINCRCTTITVLEKKEDYVDYNKMYKDFRKKNGSYEDWLIKLEEMDG